MLCPHCGHFNEGAARSCANCNAPLPQMPEPPAPAWPNFPTVSDEVVDARGNPVVSAGLAPYDQPAAGGEQQVELPPWLSPWSQPDLRGRIPAQRPEAAVDPLFSGGVGPRGYSAPQMQPADPPSGALDGGYFSSVFSSGPFGAPQIGNGGYQGAAPYAGGTAAGGALVPFRPQNLAPAEPFYPPSAGEEWRYYAGGPDDALGPGTLLKGGRYRLLQRFLSQPTLQPQGNESPLMVASDTEFAGGRVLVQELRLNDVRPEDSDNVRRLIAQRLEGLGRSQGVVKLVDQFSEHRRHFLIFELPSGESLLDRIQRARGGLEETAAIQFALQILEVLAGFERQRPMGVHGDLSPAHVMLRPSGQVTLVGLSPTLLMHPNGQVEHGPAGGIPGYSAPEQSRGQATPRSDLYTVCAILHHAVTGMAPAPRPNSMHPPARRLNPNVSLELEEVIGNGMRPSPSQRYQNVDELRLALEPLASGRRLTHVPDDLRGDGQPALVPVRDARGRLVLPRGRLSQNPLFIIAILLLTIVLVGGGLLYTLSPHAGGLAGVPTATPNDFAALYQSKGIGLSGGEFVFDRRPPGNDLKQQGARLLAAGNVRGALSAFQSAVSADQSDAEAAIYAADTQILLDKNPYVAVVAAVAFGDDDAQAAARSELQGVFLAQQHVNSLGLLPENLHVRVLILNSGLDPADATTASNVLLRQINAGNAQHLVGIIGWPESAQTRAAISALAPSGLAIVSPTSTEDGMGGNGRFFEMVPSNSDQAAVLADYVINQLTPQRVLVASDPQDPASAAAARAFTDRVNQDATAGQRVEHASFNTHQTASFDNVAHAAATQGSPLIFLAGGDQAAVALAQAVRRVNTASGTSMHILVGSSAYTPALFGVGTDPTAQAARADSAALSTLYLTSLANGGMRAKLGLPTLTQPAFADEYAAQFGPSAQAQGLDSPDPTAILSYDAARVLLAADNSGTGLIGGVLRLASPTQVRDRLRQFDASHPFMGAGGAITFTITGTQPVKALAIVTLTPVSQPAATAPIAHTSIFAVAGGQSLYCAPANCVPQ
jgi:ABC-type branched-subunit amino acid transport system substrate-binding protein